MDPAEHFADGKPCEEMSAGEQVRQRTIASLTGHLLWHGVDFEVTTEPLLCWNRMRCQPPLGGDEVIRVAQSIIRPHQRADSGRS